MLLLALLACGPGAVDVTGADAFGPVVSALWTEGGDVDVYVIDEGGVRSGVLAEGIHLFGSEYTCEDRARFLAAWSDASEAFLKAHRRGLCDDMPDFYESFATRAAGIPRPAHALDLALCTYDGCPTEFDERTYREAGATLTYGPAGSESEALRAEGAAWSRDTCRRGEVGGVETRTFADIRLSVDTIDHPAARIAGTFATDEDAKVIVTGRFDAEFCPLPDFGILLVPP